jgi:Holliday junction resolvasome RuvABC ATP-dependent DNA helicase subunit
MSQKQLKFRVEEECLRQWDVDRINFNAPFYNWIGNDAAYRRLARVIYAALGREDHQCSDFSFAILGPSSTGKTTLARMFAQTLKLPFVEIQPKAVSKVHDVFLKIAEGCEEAGLELQRIPEEWRDYDGPKPTPDIYLPPMVIFIDEVHALKDGIIQGLLNAIESRDRTMQTEPIGQNPGFKINCSRVCWMVATTERGQLFGPFDSRFLKIQLDYYTRDEIAEIVERAYPDLDEDACHLVAKFASHIPREALDFAKEMMAEQEMSKKDWEATALQVAVDRGIDEFGMSQQRLKILVALGQGPLSKNRVCLEANCQVEELEKYVMPVLLSDLSGDPALVATSTRGYCLTRAGLAELNKRKIMNRGGDAIPNGWV